MGLYEPSKEKLRVQEIRERRKTVKHKKAREKQVKRNKYKEIYKTEFAKQKAILQAEKEHARNEYKTTRALEKARQRARARVNPFKPRGALKVPSVNKKKVVHGAKVGSKFAVKYAKIGLKTLDKMYGNKPTPRKRTKRKSTKRKPVKHKPTKRKPVKRKSTKRKYKKRK